MRSLVRCLSVFALALLFTCVARAEDKKTEKKEEKKPASPFASTFAFPKQIKLTDDQQKKLDSLKAEYTPKLEDLHKKYLGIMTPERQKTSQEVVKKAREDGKKGKEIAEAVQAALKLTEDEQKQLKEIASARSALNKEINGKKMGLLTDEQKEQLKPKKKPTDK